MTEPNTPAPDLPESFLDTIFERPIAASIQPVNPESEEHEQNRLFTAERLQQLADSLTVQIAEPLNLSTIRQLSESIIQIPPATPDGTDSPNLTLLKGILLNDPGIKFAVNTVSDNLLIRSETGLVTGFFSQGAELSYQSEFKIFEYNGQKTLMLKMTDGTTEGYVAAPFLKVATPQDQSAPQATTSTIATDTPTVADVVSASAATPVVPPPASQAPQPAPAAPAEAPLAQPPSENPAPSPTPNFETHISGPEIVARDMSQVVTLSDSNGPCFNGLNPKQNIFEGRATINRQLELLYQQIDLTNPPATIIQYGGGNNFTRLSDRDASLAEASLREFIAYCSENNIQPVLSTLFLSISDVASAVPDDPTQHRRYRWIQDVYNPMVRNLAVEKGVSVIEFEDIPNPTYRVHPEEIGHPAMRARIQSIVNRTPN